MIDAQQWSERSSWKIHQIELKKDLMQSCEIPSDQIFPCKKSKTQNGDKKEWTGGKRGDPFFQGWAVMYFITGARHFPVSSLDLKDLRYKIWTKYVCRIQTLKVLRTLYNKYKELEAVWYKVWVKWMIILVGETVTWPLPEQIMERSSPKINILQANFAL